MIQKTKYWISEREDKGGVCLSVLATFEKFAPIAAALKMSLISASMEAVGAV